MSSARGSGVALVVGAGDATGAALARRFACAAGTIIFTGATASVMGRTGFAAFAGAKFAKRALAQSMARELGPQGIHVAHVIIDGPIDTAFVRDRMRHLVEARAYADNLLAPEAIAESYYAIHTQPRSAWTHELDLRPWAEPW